MRKQTSNDIEQTKALIEYFKHLTTLSTGSIVLITTFLEKLFANPSWRLAVVISIAGFMLSFFHLLLRTLLLWSMAFLRI